MLVTRVDQRRLLAVGHCGRPVHVSIAHQREQRVDAFGGKGLGQHIANLVVAHRASLFPEKTCRSHDLSIRQSSLPALSSVADATGAAGGAAPPIPSPAGEGGLGWGLT